MPTCPACHSLAILLKSLKIPVVSITPAKDLASGCKWLEHLQTSSNGAFENCFPLMGEQDNEMCRLAAIMVLGLKTEFQHGLLMLKAVLSTCFCSGW